MKTLLVAAALGCAVILSGCATAPALSVNQLQPGQSYWNTTDASARGVVILPSSKGMQVCAEPSPDAMLQTVAQLTAQVKLQNPQVDAQTQVQFSTAVIELTQRTQTVVFLREVLYRVCEQSINQNLSSDQIMQLEQLAMQTALKLAEADLSKSQSKTAEALRDPKVQRMWDQLVNGYPPVSKPNPGNTGVAGGVPTASPTPSAKPAKH